MVASNVASREILEERVQGRGKKKEKIKSARLVE
jgi:hypothetical protein